MIKTAATSQQSENLLIPGGLSDSETVALQGTKNELQRLHQRINALQGLSGTQTFVIGAQTLTFTNGILTKVV